MTVVKCLKRQFSYIHLYTRKFFVMNKTAIGKKIPTEPPHSKSKKLSSSAAMPPVNPKVDFEVLPSPVKSASDKKEYKVIRLKNGLTACLIADPRPIENEDTEESDESESEESAEGEDEDSSTDGDGDDSNEDDDDEHAPEQKMAAASLCVGVGSFSDPKHVPGMAHFLEHMVFMGSKKFPEENDFDSFISKRGGSDNASTDCEITTFYFECLEKDLFAGLDKFAQFFISPLMKKVSITREREAIESEFKMALPSDTYRKEQLLASFSSAESPVHAFAWGNLITLKDNVSEDDLYAGVHEFRKRHYSAHRMTLAIQARLPMDVLQSYVLECFSNVQSNNLPPDDFQQFRNPFDTPQFTKMYYVQPVKDIMQVELTWALPSLFHKYKSKPHQYVSWVIGDEGKGSLLSYLRKKVWVLSVAAGNRESGSEFNSIYALFTISMTLTKEGLDHLPEVIEIVFSYINMLRKLGPQERLYNEMKVISDTSFKFAREETAVEIVEELSEDMQIYPPEDYITASELYFEYDPEAIQMVLDSLIPSKMNIIVMSNKLPSGLKFDKTEEWFGTRYTQKDISKKQLKKWNNASPLQEFALPLPNQFLTEDFSILEEDENHPDYPEKVLDTEFVELWYRKDQKYQLPVAYYSFHFINPLVFESAKAAAMVEFYLNLVQICLTEEAYPAEAAHLSYTAKSYEKGIVLAVSGYNEKLHLLIELVTKQIISFADTVTEEMFKAVKDKLFKCYHNSLQQPATLAKEVRLEILISNNYYTVLNKFNVAKSITFEDLKQFSRDFISNLYIKALVQGNVTKEHAINVVNNMVTTLKCKPLNPDSIPKIGVVQVPKGETVCCMESFNTSDTNSVITNYYQSGPFSVKESVIIEFIMMIIDEPLFDTLRTKEQLGYDVRCSVRDTFRILGFNITVNAQATKNTTDYVEKRIEKFMKDATKILETMTQETFETTQRALIKTKRCVDVHLKEEFNRNWTEIIDDDYMFDKIKQEIAEIEKLTIGDLQQWWKTHTTTKDGGELRKLSIQVAGFKDTKYRETKYKNEELKLNFIDCEQANMEGEDQKQCFIKNIAEFKRTLYVYPVITINK